MTLEVHLTSIALGLLADPAEASLEQEYVIHYSELLRANMDLKDTPFDSTTWNHTVVSSAWKQMDTPMGVEMGVERRQVF